MSPTGKTAPPKRAAMYLVKACTCRASSRAWLAAYSCAPGSRKMSHRLAERLSAPCSPCRMLERLQRALWLVSRMRWPSSSRSQTAVLLSRTNQVGTMVSWSVGNGAAKST